MSIDWLPTVRCPDVSTENDADVPPEVRFEGVDVDELDDGDVSVERIEFAAGPDEADAVDVAIRGRLRGVDAEALSDFAGEHVTVDRVVFTPDDRENAVTVSLEGRFEDCVESFEGTEDGFVDRVVLHPTSDEGSATGVSFEGRLEDVGEGPFDGGTGTNVERVVFETTPGSDDAFDVSLEGRLEDVEGAFEGTESLASDRVVFETGHG